MKQAPSPPEDSIRWVLAGLALCMFAPSLSTSSANIALPTIARALGASFHQVQWVVLAYLLAVTALIVSVGRLGDLWGRRRLLVVGIAVFTASSTLCGLSTGLPWLIAARALQGFGAAIMMALAVAMVGDAVPPARTGSAMGLLGTMTAAGTALGPTVGGALIISAGWPAIFLMNMPIGCLAFYLVRRHLPPDSLRAHERAGTFDKAGTAWLAATLVCYALAMTLGFEDFGALNVGLLLAAGVSLVVFIVVERRSVEPLVRLAEISNSSLRSHLLKSVIVSTVMMAMLFVGPFYLAGALLLDAGSVGLAMSAGPLVVVVAGIPSGKAADRFGTRPLVLAGLILLAAGCLGLSTIPVRFGVAGYLASTLFLASGYALFQTANTTAVMAAASRERRGVLSGLLNLSRNLGLISGASVLGAVFAWSSGSGKASGATPAAIATGMHATFAAAAALAALAVVLAVRETVAANERGFS